MCITGEHAGSGERSVLWWELREVSLCQVSCLYWLASMHSWLCIKAWDCWDCITSFKTIQKDVQITWCGASIVCLCAHPVKEWKMSPKPQYCIHQYLSLVCRKIKNAIIGNKMKKSSFMLLGVIPRSVPPLPLLFWIQFNLGHCISWHKDIVIIYDLVKFRLMWTFFWLFLGVIIEGTLYMPKAGSYNNHAYTGLGYLYSSSEWFDCILQRKCFFYRGLAPLKV